MVLARRSVRGQAWEGGLPHRLAEQRDREADQQEGVVDGRQAGRVVGA